jgi:hypothetical protein
MKHKKPVRTGKRGPSPERLKIKGDWEGAVEKALKKERPKEGWPQQNPAKPK